MTDELKQLAHDRVECEFEEYNTLHETEIEKLLVSFGAEVQRQTVEALLPYLRHWDNCRCRLWPHCEGTKIIQGECTCGLTVLSPAQEVRNG